MIKIDKLKLSLEESEEILLEKIRKLLNDDNITTYQIIKKSLDARRREDPFFLYQVVVDITLSEKALKKLEKKGVSLYEEVEEVITFGQEVLENPPLVIGFGPAGLFCAYELAKYGYQPIVLEQGECITKRVESVEKFWQEGKLNLYSNVQFGEGGAGTFSDGKLTSRSKSPFNRLVLETFVNHMAPPEILYEKKPHIGTDLLRPIITSMRQKIEENGGWVNFEHRVVDFIVENNQIIGVKLDNGKAFYSEVIILAVGHSARGLFRLLQTYQVALENKPFAVGFRIEHPQDFINKHQYRDYANSPYLTAADYQLTYHDNKSNRGVYTFCMCPGGEVVLASSEEGRLCVNGMSYHSRDKVNANSAILVSVDERDYGCEPLAGLKFQEMLEEKAFLLTGENNVAPVQTLADFCNQKITTKLRQVSPSVVNYKLSNLSSLLPAHLYRQLKEALGEFDKKFSDFAMEDAILTGIETRSSSPLKILRDSSNLRSISHPNLYPIGEGAGYAGGIVSSAIDGIKVSRKIMEQYTRLRNSDRGGIV